MIDAETRQAVFNLYQAGMTFLEISHRLKIDRKTVRSIIKSQGKIHFYKRKDTVVVDENLLIETYKECQGWIERVHDKLQEKGVEIGYSTLTRRVRELGLNEKPDKRSDKVPDEAGEEFQHDTSPYVITVGAGKLKVVGSEIYYRFSKRKYVKFYTSFTRFKMKCFFHEALTYFGFVPGVCVIDNTNLAILRGTGKNAVINPEMESFAKIYGFDWLAHEIMHSDRKAGVERGFWTLETNFFPGRTFKSLDDLNQQVFEWCEKHALTANKKTKIIPIEVFEVEKSAMRKVPSDLPAPYLTYKRLVDQYGYIAFDANFYWIPRGTDREVIVLEYSAVLKIFDKRKMAVEYKLPTLGIKGQRFSPNELMPAYRPKKQSMPTNSEEMALKSLGKEVEEYLSQIRKGSSLKYRYREIRNLYALYRRLAPSVFLKTIIRALSYGVYEVDRLEGISIHILKEENLVIPDPDIAPDFDQRESYLEGKIIDVPDLSYYRNKYGGEYGKEN
jgi:transposase